MFFYLNILPLSWWYDGKGERKGRAGFLIAKLREQTIRSFLPLRIFVSIDILVVVRCLERVGRHIGSIASVIVWA
jgi:hypothetical protein